MRFTTFLLAGPALAAATPALAQDTAPPPPVTVTGSATILTDYRLRGVSQTDKDAAVQGSLTVAHESGFYIGTFASNLSGWGTFGGANIELDAIGGYKHTFGTTTVDGGVTWYTYPGGASNSDVVEVFGRLSGALGPGTLTAGAYYAPKQDSTSRYYRTAADYGAGIQTGRKRYDNLYLTGDAVVGVPNTRFTGRAHVGWSKGNNGLGPNGTSLAPTGEYWDWNAGVDWNVYKMLTLSASYVDTDIGKRESAYLAPNFRDRKGASISDPTVVFSLSAAF